MGEGLSYIPKEATNKPVENKKIDEAEYVKSRLHYEYAQKASRANEGEKPAERETKEADQFIKLLDRKEFDFLGIDWNKLDLSNIEQIEKAKSRISTALEVILQEQNTDKPTMVSFRRNQGRLALSLLSMMLASTLLTKGVQFGAERSRQMQKIEQIKSNKREKVTGSFKDFISDYYKDMITEWLDQNPEIKNVEISMLASDGSGDNHKWHINADATIVLHFTNEGTLELKGESNDGGGDNSIFDTAMGNTLDAIERKTGLGGAGYQIYATRENGSVQFDSVIDALKKYGETKRINEVDTLLGNLEQKK